MPRSVPGQAHLDTRQTTTCWALRIAPRSGDPFGLCSTNQDVTVTDPHGTLTYIAAYGFDPSAVEATSGQGVDNAEAQALFAPIADFGITVAMVDSGYLDGAKFWQYIVDYTTGDIIALAHFGFLGEVRYKDKQLVIPDLVSLSQMAKQKGLCEAGSKTCRASYGVTSTGCPATWAWTEDASVSAEGVEQDRVFETAATIAVGSVILWATGANAGRHSVVESFDTGVVALRHPTPYVIEAGDTFDFRIDCDKKWGTCKTLLGSAAVTSFRGEPFRKEAIGDALQTPGATTR